MWVQIEIKSECQGHSVEIKEFFCHYNFTWNQGHRNYYRMINEIENPNNHFLVNLHFGQSSKEIMIKIKSTKSWNNLFEKFSIYWSSIYPIFKFMSLTKKASPIILSKILSNFWMWLIFSQYVKINWILVKMIFWSRYFHKIGCTEKFKVAHKGEKDFKCHLCERNLWGLAWLLETSYEFSWLKIHKNILLHFKPWFRFKVWTSR